MTIYFVFTFMLLITSCGLSKDSSKPRFESAAIVGGELVLKNQFLGVVAIVRNGDIICSGVAIDPRIILTAAHCLVNQTKHSLKVYVGNGAKLSTHKTYIKAQYNIDQIVIHPDLIVKRGLGITNFGEYDANDVGLLYLSEKLENVEVYKLFTEMSQVRESLKSGTKATVVGFGYTGEENPFMEGAQKIEYGLKRMVEVPIAGLNNHEVDIRALGKDSCYVDSGGPAFIRNGDSFEILGIVSGSDGLCGEAEFPVYYSLLLDSACWISKETGIESDDLNFHCDRNKQIKKSCGDLSTGSAKLCAITLSYEILFRK